jgi:hypothetical protein
VEAFPETYPKLQVHLHHLRNEVSSVCFVIYISLPLIPVHGNHFSHSTADLPHLLGAAVGAAAPRIRAAASGREEGTPPLAPKYHRLFTQQTEHTPPNIRTIELMLSHLRWRGSSSTKVLACR